MLRNYSEGEGGSQNDYVIFDWHPNAYRGEGGSEGAKMWLRNIWMLPNFFIVMEFFLQLLWIFKDHQWVDFWVHCVKRTVLNRGFYYDT